MRKSNLIIAILLIISLVLLGLSVLAKNKSKNENEPEYIANIKFNNKDELIAVAYLDDTLEAYTKYTSDLGNIKVYQTEGKDMYLIIPRYKDIEIDIYNATVEGEKLIKTDKIISTSLPFIITCNTDEGNNIIIEVKQKDLIFEYSPSINAENGKLNINKNILDITEYKEEEK